MKKASNPNPPANAVRPPAPPAKYGPSPLKEIRERFLAEERKEVSWTFVDGNTQEIYCKRCGKREHIPLPMPVLAFTKFCDYFNEKHRGCIDKMQCTFGGHKNYVVCPVCNGKKK